MNTFGDLAQHYMKYELGEGNHSDAITDADASYIQSTACGGYVFESPDDVCSVLLRDQRDPHGDWHCLQAEKELVALSLNLNHGRVSLSDGIDSHCGYNATVAGAFIDARRIICSNPCLVEPCDIDDSCDLAECYSREINQGRALHVHALVASRLADGIIRLSWIPPVADPDSLATTPRRYRVWRGTVATGPFVEIAEVAETTFDDTTAQGERLVYDVTPVW